MKWIERGIATVALCGLGVYLVHMEWSGVSLLGVGALIVCVWEA